MSGCDRFERQGLARLERGLPLGEHYRTCPDCARAAASYRRLVAALSEAGEDCGPAPGWQDRVWREIGSRRRRVRLRRLARVVLPAAAALAVALLLQLRLEPAAPAPSFTVAVVEGSGAPRRGAAGRSGDRLEIEARGLGEAAAELRVYLDDATLVFRCADGSGCPRRGGLLRASFEVREPGRYQPVLLLGESEPAPPLGGGLDRDLDAALGAGASALLGDPVDVR